MRPIYIEKCILVLKQVVLIARVVLILSGLNSRTVLFIIQIVYTQIKMKKHLKCILKNNLKELTLLKHDFVLFTSTCTVHFNLVACLYFSVKSIC